jgi:hypothetical protein
MFMKSPRQHRSVREGGAESKARVDAVFQKKYFDIARPTPETTRVAKIAIGFIPVAMQFAPPDAAVY